MDAFWYFLALRSRSARATTRARAVLSSEAARFTASTPRGVLRLRRLRLGAPLRERLPKPTAAARASRRLAHGRVPFGCSRFTVEPGETLMMPGLWIARAAASAASARSNLPMGAAASSKRSTAFAERLTVTRGTAFEPAEDMPPAAMGAVRVVAEAEETPAAYGLARPPLPPYSSVGGARGSAWPRGYSRASR